MYDIPVKWRTVSDIIAYKETYDSEDSLNKKELFTNTEQGLFMCFTNACKIESEISKKQHTIAAVQSDFRY